MKDWKDMNDDELAEYYELHDVTDHLDKTEEVSSIIYQDANGKWWDGKSGQEVSWTS